MPYVRKKEEKRKRKMKLLKQTKEKIEKLATQVALDHNCFLYDLEFKNKTLRVFIDKKQRALNLDDCTEVSYDLGRKLDEGDFLKASYDLEISSPGIEKVLKKPWHFKESLGQTIKVKMEKSYEGLKGLEGELCSLKKDHILLKKEDKTHCLPLEFILKAQVTFPKKKKEKKQKKKR